MSTENPNSHQAAQVASEANGNGLSKDVSHMSDEEILRNVRGAARFGYGPLASGYTGPNANAAFGGEFQPGLFASPKSRKFANPAPLGLSAFALTTFILSLINLHARSVMEPNIVVASAFGYGGLVQLLAGMWEMAVGNTFGATALSSYGGFWIAFAITLTPGGFNIVDSYTVAADGTKIAGGAQQFGYAFGFFLFGWFIFTTLLVMAVLRSTVAFFFLFFTLDMAFLLLAIGYILTDAEGKQQPGCIKAGGVFGILAAFAAWYNALVGILDETNSFFLLPVAHFPWSAKGEELREVDMDETKA